MKKRGSRKNAGAAGKAGGLSRRQAFKQMMGELMVFVDESRGQKHVSLKKLEMLDDDSFGEFVPMPNREAKLAMDGDWLEKWDRETGEKMKILELNPGNREAFKLISRGGRIADIATVLSRQMDWERERAFACVKKMFITLLKHQVYTIANLPEE